MNESNLKKDRIFSCGCEANLKKIEFFDVGKNQNLSRDLRGDVNMRIKS